MLNGFQEGMGAERACEKMIENKWLRTDEKYEPQFKNPNELKAG